MTNEEYQEIADQLGRNMDGRDVHDAVLTVLQAKFPEFLIIRWKDVPVDLVEFCAVPPGYAPPAPLHIHRSEPPVDIPIPPPPPF